MPSTGGPVSGPAVADSLLNLITVDNANLHNIVANFNKLLAEATRLVDVCFSAGLNMFDSADVYSDGLAEEILGQAIRGRRE